jgi:hypothetical protein
VFKIVVALRRCVVVALRAPAEVKRVHWKRIFAVSDGSEAGSTNAQGCTFYEKHVFSRGGNVPIGLSSSDRAPLQPRRSDFVGCHLDEVQNASCYPARWGKDPASQKTASIKLYERMLRSYCSRRGATSLTEAAFTRKFLAVLL